VIAVLFFVPALNLGGIPPFSGFIGKLALFEASAQQGTVLAHILIGAGALVSLLTLYALMRVWNMAFWRPADDVEGYESTLLKNVSEAPNAAATQPTRTTPRIMTAVTAAMVVVSLALTVFAGPLFAVSSRAGENLEGPSYYIDIVFPGGRDD
jgi:multicomponent Na+:H+ antiporter subunit D